MAINFLKTKEMVFHRPNPRNIVYPPVLDSTERVRVAKLLGVFVQSNFCCEEHVKYILSCSLQPACVFDEIIKGQRSPTPSATTHLSGSNNFQDTILSFSMGRVPLC